MDVPIIMENLSTGKYSSPDHFREDLNLMWQNLELFQVMRAKIIESDSTTPYY